MGSRLVLLVSLLCVLEKLAGLLPEEQTATYFGEKGCGALNGAVRLTVEMLSFDTEGGVRGGAAMVTAQKWMTIHAA